MLVLIGWQIKGWRLGAKSQISFTFMFVPHLCIDLFLLADAVGLLLFDCIVQFFFFFLILYSSNNGSHSSLKH